MGGDALLEMFCNDFEAAKALQQLGHDKPASILFDRWGLLDDPLTLLELEGIYQQWRQNQQNKRTQ